MSRRSIFSKENTSWAFLGQVLDADGGGCKGVVRKLQSYSSLKGGKVPSSSTASYCTVRKKLDEQTLTSIFQYTAVHSDKSTNTGLLKIRIGNKKSNEKPLFRKQWQIFKAGDIFLGDKGFCSYFDMAKLKKQGVDSVLTLARRKPVSHSKCL